MDEDERPGEERGQDELIAAFAALGGPLTGHELMRLLGSDEDYRLLGPDEGCDALVRLAALLLDGDTAAAGDVVRDSLTAQHAWRGLGDPEKARVYLRQAVVNRSRSVRRHRAADGHHAPPAVSGAPATRRAGIGDLEREPSIAALRPLPDRQREAVVLRGYLGLSEEQVAKAMGISIGAVRSHLASGISSLRRRPRPE